MAYGYGGYPVNNGYYPPQPPIPDQLAQLRNNQYQQPMASQQIAQPVQQPQVPTIPVMNQPQQMTMSGPVFVNGEAGAKGYLVAPNNTVMLLDADPDAHTFWLKSADASGMPSMRTFDYTERIMNKPNETGVERVEIKNVDYVTRDEWKALKERADALADELEQLKAKKTTAVKKASKEDDE